jgi:hypothetical protein
MRISAVALYRWSAIVLPLMGNARRFDARLRPFGVVRSHARSGLHRPVPARLVTTQYNQMGLRLTTCIVRKGVTPSLDKGTSGCAQNFGSSLSPVDLVVVGRASLFSSTWRAARLWACAWSLALGYPGPSNAG